MKMKANNRQKTTSNRGVQEHPTCYPIDKLVDLDEEQRKMSSKVRVYDMKGNLLRVEESVKPRLKRGPWTLKGGRK